MLLNIIFLISCILTYIMLYSYRQLWGAGQPYISPNSETGEGNRISMSVIQVWPTHFISKNQGGIKPLFSAKKRATVHFLR